MIIWQGRGFLVFLILICCSAIANIISNSTTGSDQYWKTHNWPLGIAFLSAAVVCWFLGQAYHKTPGRVLLDPKSGQEVVLRPSHTLFFIPVRWWGPIFAVIGLGAIIRG